MKAVVPPYSIPLQDLIRVALAAAAIAVASE